VRSSLSAKLHPTCFAADSYNDVEWTRRLSEKIHTVVR